jgi:hypothetical protein
MQGQAPVAIEETPALVADNDDDDDDTKDAGDAEKEERGVLEQPLGIVDTNPAHKRAIMAVMPVPDHAQFGGELISCGLDKSVRIFRNGVKIQELKGHKSAVVGVVVLENGLMATAASDGEVKVWSGTSGGKKPCTILKTLKSANHEECTAIAAMRNGDIAVGSETGQIVFWRPRGVDDPPANAAADKNDDDDDDDGDGVRTIRDDTRGTLKVGNTDTIVGRFGGATDCSCDAHLSSVLCCSLSGAIGVLWRSFVFSPLCARNVHSRSKLQHTTLQSSTATSIATALVSLVRSAANRRESAGGADTWAAA